MKLCFLDASPMADGAVRGSALVTDARTRPLEFRVTEPVIADELQGLLYGAVLDEHVLGDLCALPLLEALRESPDCILVRDQALLGLQAFREEPVLVKALEEEARAVRLERSELDTLDLGPALARLQALDRRWTERRLDGAEVAARRILTLAGYDSVVQGSGPPGASGQYATS